MNSIALITIKLATMALLAASTAHAGKAKNTTRKPNSDANLNCSYILTQEDGTNKLGDFKVPFKVDQDTKIKVGKSDYTIHVGIGGSSESNNPPYSVTLLFKVRNKAFAVARSLFSDGTRGLVELQTSSLDGNIDIPSIVATCAGPY